MTFFSADDQTRISKAIADAEAKTSGEIVAVVADMSDRYHYVPFLWAAMAALLVPWPFIHFTWMSVQVIYVIQLVVFIALLIVLWPQNIRAGLVPRSVRRAHAHRRATEQFLSQNLHTTDGRTGVLIFVSIAEHYAEVLADKSIDAKVPSGTWQAIIDRLTADLAANNAVQGFIAAIEDTGRHLAQHFPPGAHDPNELPDHLIVLTS